MSMKKLFLALGLWPLLIVVQVVGQGTILWDEAVNGPVSDNSAGPTTLPSLQLGTNSLMGATEIEPSGGIWNAQHDFFTLSVPSGTSISAVYLEIDKPNVWLWIGSPTFDIPFAFIMNPTSGELLAQWGVGRLGQGLYGMYIGNANAQAAISIAAYRLDLVVVPEPSPLCLLLGGLGWFGIRRWRRA